MLGQTASARKLWERARGDCACTCIGSQVGKRERRLYLYLCWVTGGKARKKTVPVPVPGHRWEREEIVPVPVLGHRWESERGDCACTCAWSQVGK